MDGLQAAILNVKLPHLATWTRKRQEIANAYLNQLAGVGDLILPQIDARASHVWHLFVIRTKQRDALKAFLADNGVQTVINYPVALPFLDAYAYQNNTIEDFPAAHGHQSDILSLPIFPEIANDQISLVSDLIGRYFSGEKCRGK
jgi:dTDP-4-amino-4,6-dideoxygalactose transaminase